MVTLGLAVSPQMRQPMVSRAAQLAGVSGRRRSAAAAPANLSATWSPRSQGASERPSPGGSGLARRAGRSSIMATSQSAARREVAASLGGAITLDVVNPLAAALI